MKGSLFTDMLLVTFSVTELEKCKRQLPDVGVAIKHLSHSLDRWVFLSRQYVWRVLQWGELQDAHGKSDSMYPHSSAHGGSPAGLSVGGGCDSAQCSLRQNTWKTHHNAR